MHPRRWRRIWVSSPPAREFFQITRGFVGILESEMGAVVFR